MGAALKAAVTPLLLRSAAVAALGGFLFGFDTSRPAWASLRGRSIAAPRGRSCS